MFLLILSSSFSLSSSPSYCYKLIIIFLVVIVLSLKELLALLVPITTSTTTITQTILNNNNIRRCGRQMIKDWRKAKVVGGHDTYEGEFPWIVSIRKNGNHHCGGIIVGQRWILTAAHCVHNSEFDSNHNNNSEQQLIVRVGEYDLFHTNETHSRDYYVDQKYIHDNYSRINSWKPNNYHHPLSIYINNADIALLKTEDDIHLNEYAWPICFPPTNTPIPEPSPGQTAIVVGWGKINEKSNSHSDILQKADLRIIDQKQCSEWFKLAGRNFEIKDNILCAGYKDGGIDACHGDSGGPLLIKHQNDFGADYYYVAGIVSTGIGCARPLLPGIYSNVSVYINWIYKVITQYY